MHSAIIGGGFISKKHIEGIKKMGWELLGVYDIVPSRSTLEFTDLEKADIIHICTPNAFHVPYMKQFVHKKLIVEKPIGLNLDIPDIDACVCYQRRFDEQAVEMKKRCDLLKPMKIIANIFVPRDNWYWETWRGEGDISGGGALMNIGIHYIDLLQWWLGDGEILDVKIGYFNRVMDESAFVKMKFGNTEVDFHLNARANVRKIQYMAFWPYNWFKPWDTEYFIYDTDEATHYELFKGWTEGRYVTPKEAVKSLKLINEIYSYQDRSHHP